MESTNQFYKFELFKKLIEDITNLINNLQSQIIKILSNNQSSPKNVQPRTNKLGLFQKLKSIWPLNKFVKESSLHDYLKINEQIENICQEIILENFEFVIKENNNQQITQILIKFNNDFKELIKKYADILKKDYDKEKQEYIKKTGVPDETPDEDIKTVTDTAVSMKDAVNKGVSKVLQNKSNSHSFSNNWFDNGEIKFEYFGEVLDYLLNEDIDVKDEEKIKKVFGSNYNPQSSFYSKLLKIYGDEDAVSAVEAKIINRDLIIGSVEELVNDYAKLKTDQIISTFEEIEELNEDKQKRKQKIIESKEREKNNNDLQWKILFNISINDDLRVKFIQAINS